MRGDGASDLRATISRMSMTLHREGFALRRGIWWLTDDELLIAARQIGRPQPELDDVARRHARSRHILDLHALGGPTTDRQRQPFTTASIALHTEGSRRSRRAQPSHLVLYCDEASEGAGETLIVRTEDVVARLSARTVAVLGKLRPTESAPTVLRWVGPRPVLSWHEQELATDYRCDEAAIGTDAIAAALAELGAAARDPKIIHRIRWEPGTFAVLDNAAVIHGRGASMPGATRQLRRVRVRSPWSPAEPGDPIHQFLVASDSYQATPTAPAPVRSPARTRAAVDKGAVQVLRGEDDRIEATFTLDVPGSAEEHNRTGQMRRLAVRPDVIDNGLHALRCYRRAIEMAKNHGLEALQIDVNPDLGRVRSLALQLGFVPEGEVRKEGGLRSERLRITLAGQRQQATGSQLHA